MNYRREIDGLRALAILPVIFFHAGFAGFSGGFVGVDVFFVISGYLITSLIITEKEAQRFSIVRFYERRARRILPALFFVMALCVPAAWWLMLPDDMKKFSQSLVSVPLFMSNILFRKESVYFDSSAEYKPLLHTWSLAIEEQYYVLFPLLVVMLWKFGRARIAMLLVVIAALSLCYAQYKVTHRPSSAFYLLFSRAWELLIGALAAFYHTSGKDSVSIPKSIREAAALAGIALIFYAIVTFNERTPFPGLYALIPTLGTALVILFARPDTIAGKILCNKILVGIGLVSYSAYLWHHPIFAFLRVGGIEHPPQSLLIAVSIATFVFAYVSWRFIEKPFRDISRVSRRTIFIFAISGSLFFIALGTAGRITRGYEQYFLSHRVNEQELGTYNQIKAQTGGDMYNDMVDDGKCNFWSRQTDEAFTKRFEACAKTHKKAVIVLGDSHAMNIYNALAYAKAAPFMVGVSQGGCRPYDGLPICHYAEFDRFLASHGASVDTIFYHQSGSHLLRDYMGREDYIEIFSEKRGYSIDRDNIEKLASYLTDLSGKGKLIWLGPFAEARYDFRNFRKAANEGFLIKQHTLDVFKALDDVIRAKPYPFAYVSLVELFAIRPESLKQGDCIMYRDGDHFSICGEKIIGEKLKKALLQRSN